MTKKKFFCFECKKEIDDQEWVVNWGSCEECFNKHLDEYFEKDKKNEIR